MKAMILAAGLGTRLRPLTDDRPKALVEINGCSLLEIVLARLRKFGVSDVIVNVHHFADQVVKYLEKNDNFGMRIEISRENLLLDTGGGLKKAAWFLSEPAGSSKDASFILHNVDVLSAIDLGRMFRQHLEHQALATLAMQRRQTSRYLIFNERGRLCGRRSGVDGVEEMVVPVEHPNAWAFCGIHIISARLLSLMTEEGGFSIIHTYLRLAAAGENIQAFRADEYYWRDLGKPESIAQAENDLKLKAVEF
jgi:NDP-sugar pyrophosphorylase family protein